MSLVMIYEMGLLQHLLFGVELGHSQGAGGGMSDDEDRRSLSEDEDGEIEDGGAVDAIGGEEGGADGASVDGELERDRLEMLARLDAKASMEELMMQRAEELDYHASDMYNDDDDSCWPPVEVDEYEPVEYQVATREPSSLAQIYGDGASAGVELKPSSRAGSSSTASTSSSRGRAPTASACPRAGRSSGTSRWCRASSGVRAGWITPRVHRRGAHAERKKRSERASRRGSITPPRRRVTSSRRCSPPCPRGRRGAAAGRRREIEGKRRRRERRRSGGHSRRSRDAKGPYGSTDARDLLRRIGDGPFPPEHYLLSAADMAEMEYPIPTLVPTLDTAGDDDAAAATRPARAEEAARRRGTRGIDVTRVGVAQGTS